MNSANVGKTHEPGNKFIIQYAQVLCIFTDNDHIDEISLGFSTYKDTDHTNCPFNGIQRKELFSGN